MTIFINSSLVVFGLSKSIIVALRISVILCEGISVDIPTAIPELPLIMIFGIFDGSCLGSNNEPSKFGFHCTVPLSISSKKRSEKDVKRDSVYLIAAKDFGSS